jgi:O-antigen ligase
VAAAIAGLWPLTAYSLDPLLLPAALAVVTVAVVVLLRPEYGIALALALIPFANLNIGGRRPVYLLLATLAVGLALYGPASIRERRESAARWVTLGLIVFLVATLASSLAAIDPAASLPKLVILLAAVALFFAVRQVCRTRRELTVAVAGALVGLLLAGAYGLVQHATGGTTTSFELDGSVIGRVQGAFVHPNKYGVYLATLIPLAASFALARRSPTRLRWLGAGALALAVPALAFSFSRGAMVGLAVGSLIWLAVVRPRVAPVAALAVIAAAVILAPGTLKERFEPEGTEGDIAVRRDIWGAALDIYSDHPLLGAGVNNFRVAYAELPSTLDSASQRRLLYVDAAAASAIPYHAHNVYLNVLAEEGIVGLAAFLLVALAALGVLYRASRVRDPVSRAVGLGIGAGAMTWAVRSFVDVALFEEPAFLLLALVALATRYVELDRGEAGED